MDVNAGLVGRIEAEVEARRDAAVELLRALVAVPSVTGDEAAAQTHFGRLAASGWHTCSMMMGAMVRHWQATPGWQESSLGAMGIDELRWRKPVFPGDTLRGTSELIEKIESRSRPEMGIVKFRTRLLNQHDEEVLSLVSTAMRKRRPA